MEKSFRQISGVITMIEDLEDGQTSGCYKRMTVEDDGGNIVNFIAGPDTYFVGRAMMEEGDAVTGFYDTNVPVVMIYPPQYQAVVMARDLPYRSVVVDYFDGQMVSSDGMLKLHISPFTRVVLQNGQAFTQNPANRYLIVLYGATTRSIPAQTVPIEIIVMCPLER